MVVFVNITHTRRCYQPKSGTDAQKLVQWKRANEIPCELSSIFFECAGGLLIIIGLFTQIKLYRRFDLYQFTACAARPVCCCATQWNGYRDRLKPTVAFINISFTIERCEAFGHDNNEWRASHQSNNVQIMIGYAKHLLLAIIISICCCSMVSNLIVRALHFYDQTFTTM